ncbi:S8 family serine peptidase [Micromonospora musae]|uniref:Peptidase S8 and S53 subtilisin kexin sedolisin n=1 Tax=Micromonospora musae TaxID=1894970 RepID=A0A3A9YA12_9ACTN|nr:S8 family serine peptidase [Micromonospora musae]RKN34138.1 peptidase S8 and S53 subtilisin kexin sedolisin [Micromonospora musae]
MTAKVRAWPILLGGVAMVAALPQLSGAGQRSDPLRPALVSVAAPATPTPNADAQNGAFVKYYTVAAGADGAESLAAIAGRLLGAANRAEELYRLNVGRRQADGQSLTDSRQLRAGWTLILPWDAVGDGVRIGPLPTQPSSGPDQAPPVPPVQPPKPPAKPGGGTRLPASSQCANSVPSRPGSGWAQERMAPDQAWGRTRGAGVLVAVVDSGVDAGLPELSGRVAVGADIPSGSGRGDVDCLGSGTAMASIIGARPAETPPAGAAAAPVVGVAPEATILPLRVVGDVPQSKPADAATAIEVAVSAGARVVALGAFVDLADPAVAEAIGRASEHDVVVVAPAATGTAASPSPAAGDGPEALLRVGGVGPEGQPAANYQPSGADVIAPGIDVASLGAGGSGVRASSGSQYAVAFVAGTATLVRSAFPNLSAAQVTHRIKTTADRAGRPDADPATGWGMIDPNAAVVTTLAEEAPPAPDDAGGSGALRILVIALLAVAGIAAIALLARRPGAGGEAATDDTGDEAGDDGGEPAGRERPDDATATDDGGPATPGEDPEPTADDASSGADATGEATTMATAAGTSGTDPAGARW